VDLAGPGAIDVEPGGTNTNSAHRRIAVVEGTAERTPKARAS
jgi:hypothetical protein